MRVGPYEVGSQLGHGGMGAVFRARAPDGREVALKVILGNDPRRAGRFQRESRLLATLGEADGFVPLLDTGATPAGAYIVMPLLPGGTLRDRLARGPLGIDETVALGRTLAAALGRAHAKGIVHRDMKPENVLFTASGQPLIADLGLGKHWDIEALGGSQSISISAHGEARGTVGYMAPEQLADAKTAGPPADVFGLGATLYECLAGGPPFVAPTGVELTARVMDGLFAPLGGLRPDAPSWLVAVIERALAPGLEERWPDGVALARALSEPPRRRKSVLALGLAVLAVAVAIAIVPRRRAVPVARPVPPPRPVRSAADEARALVEVGGRKIRGRDVEGARVSAERAIALDPRCAGAWDLLGMVRAEHRELEAALACADKAIELDPRLSIAWSNRSTYRSANGDHVRAFDDASHAIELDPKNGHAWFEHGKFLGEKGDTAGEIEEETRAIALDPELVGAWSNRSAARLDRGDNDGAIDDATHAIDLNPDNAYPWVNRGIARHNKGEYALAIADITRAIDLDPSVGMAWLVRSRAREATGDGDGAARDLEKFLERWPDDPQADLVREHLTKLRAR